MERHCWLWIHPCNGIRSYSHASHSNRLIRGSPDKRMESFSSSRWHWQFTLVCAQRKGTFFLLSAFLSCLFRRDRPLETTVAKKGSGWCIKRSIYTTEWMGWMSDRKHRETKQEPSMLPGPAVPGCCLVSICFLCDIHSIDPLCRAVLFMCSRSGPRMREFLGEVVSEHLFLVTGDKFMLQWIYHSSIREPNFMATLQMGPGFTYWQETGQQMEADEQHLLTSGKNYDNIIRSDAKTALVSNECIEEKKPHVTLKLFRLWNCSDNKVSLRLCFWNPKFERVLEETFSLFWLFFKNFLNRLLLKPESEQTLNITLPEFECGDSEWTGNVAPYTKHAPLWRLEEDIRVIGSCLDGKARKQS